MSEEKHVYIAVDLKSFYASVEAVERGLDPLTTNIVVADSSRTEKTICLAVSPSLKAYGISGRARLFEVVQKVREVNAVRLAGGILSVHLLMQQNCKGIRRFRCRTSRRCPEWHCIWNTVHGFTIFT